MKRGKRASDRRQLQSLTIDKAKARTKPYLIWDATQRHLALAVRPTGVKSWKVIYSRHGRSRWLTLGSADIIGLADARIKAAEIMLAVTRDGKDPAAEKRAERGAGTFAELASKYVEQHAKKHNKSWTQADTLIRRYVLPKWGKLQAAAITRGDVKQMMARIEAPILANQVLAAVSAIYSWGMKEEIVAANPCKLVARNDTRARERVLADSEIPLFWNALSDIDSVRATALKVILLLGQRPGEVVNMRREHIVDGWWKMPGAVVPDIWPGTKNGESHDVWLSEPIRSLIPDNGKKVGFVFAGPRGGPIGGLDVAMRDICKRLGVERATPHDLRRTFGTRVTKLKFGREAMDRLLNHRHSSKKKQDTTDVYDRHEYAEDNQHVWETVAARIMALAEGREAVDNNVRYPQFRSK
jgi:integrase